MNSGNELEKLVDVMKYLRGSDGCPWDREQTIESLRTHVLEEVHELLEAMTNKNMESIREELGDVLLEIVFITQISAEANHFTMSDVIKDVRGKIIRRHPHVFNQKEAITKEQALDRWDEIKSHEKPIRDSLLDRISSSLPSLTRASKLSKQASGAGFDWSSKDEVMKKVEEELKEFTMASTSGSLQEVHEELGDLLFTIVNLARHHDTDAELALIDANQKFSKRFHYMETNLARSGRSLEEASKAELEQLWKEAKKV